MESSLDSHIGMIKGYLLNQQTPPEIMASVDALLAGLRNKSMLVRADKNLDALISERLDVKKEIEIILPPEVKPTVKRPRRCKLSKDDLAGVQREHDRGDPNGIIAARYSVSDQTIVNFLKQFGNYEPKAKGGRPARKVVDTPEEATFTPTDPLGLPLVTLPAARDPSKRAIPPGPLKAVDLIDVHDMLSAGKDCDDIAEHYLCTKRHVEAFILAHRNAQLTKYPPKRLVGAEVDFTIKSPVRGRNGD